MRWMIEIGSGIGSGRSVLMARHDDDDDDISTVIAVGKKTRGHVSKSRT